MLIANPVNDDIRSQRLLALSTLNERDFEDRDDSQIRS